MNPNMTNLSLDMKDHQDFIASSVIVICSQFLSFLIGLPLNCYILFLLFTQDVGKDMDVTFTVSQSAAEVLLSFTAPLSITCHLNSDLCFTKALGFFWGISMSARCHFQCCFCVERYIAVVHPITFLKYKRMSYRLPCAVVSWINALVCAVSTMFTFPQLPFSTLAAMYGFVFIVDLFCLLIILKALREPGPCGTEQVRDEARGNAVKQKAFKIVFVNLIVFLVQTIPLLTVFMLKQKLSLEVFNFWVAISLSVNFTAGFVHPIVFLHKAKKLQLIRCL